MSHSFRSATLDFWSDFLGAIALSIDSIYIFSPGAVPLIRAMAPLQLRDDPSTVDSDAGAAGPSSGSIQLSTGALVAVIVGVVLVVIFGSNLRK